MSIIMQQFSQQEQKVVLINLFKGCLNILRDSEGLTGEKALRDMAYLLTLKLMESHIGAEIDIDNYPDYSFDDIEESSWDLLRTTLFPLVRFSNLAATTEDLPYRISQIWKYILAQNPATSPIFTKDGKFNIKKQTTFKKLINKFHALDLTNCNYDVLGNAYEEVIQDIMTGKVLGQFFTQPLVKQMMVKLIDPQIYPDGTIETVCDPTMGTGGFLITYLKHILQQAATKNITPNWNFIKNEGIYGKELEPDTYKLAVSNMLISSGHLFDKLANGDSIREPIAPRKFDNILANPPFGIKGLNYDEFNNEYKKQYTPIKSNNAVSLFIQAIIYMLKINGRCAVVLPDGQDLFSKSNTALVAVRKYLMKTCDLKEIIYLPSGIFTYTSVKTCVFYFVKKAECDAVLLPVAADVTTKKSRAATKKAKDDEYNFAEGHHTSEVAFYNYDFTTESKTLLVTVPIDRIVANGYALNYAEYIEKVETKYSAGVEIKTLGEICAFLPKSKRQASYGNTSGAYPFYTSSAVCNKFCDEPDYNAECVIIGTGGNANIKYDTNFSCSTDNFIIKLKDNTLCIMKYLYYYLSNNIHLLQNGFTGSGLQHISKDYVNKIEIPIPPLERQKEIVEYLDFITGTNKTSATKIEDLKRLNKYCLDELKYGNVENKTLGEVCQIKCGNHSTKKSSFIDGEYLIIGGGKHPIGTHNQYNCDENVILCASHGTAGYISMYPVKTFITMAFAFIENKTLVNKIYLYYYLKLLEEYLITLGKGTAQPCISMEKLKSIKIPIPSLERQKEIVEYCEYNDTLIRQLEKEIENNMARAKACMNSIIV